MSRFDWLLREVRLIRDLSDCLFFLKIQKRAGSWFTIFFLELNIFLLVLGLYGIVVVWWTYCFGRNIGSWRVYRLSRVCRFRLKDRPGGMNSLNFGHGSRCLGLVFFYAIGTFMHQMVRESIRYFDFFGDFIECI